MDFWAYYWMWPKSEQFSSFFPKQIYLGRILARNSLWYGIVLNLILFFSNCGLNFPKIELLRRLKKSAITHKLNFPTSGDHLYVILHKTLRRHTSPWCHTMSFTGHSRILHSTRYSILSLGTWSRNKRWYRNRLPCRVVVTGSWRHKYNDSAAANERGEVIADTC